MSQFGRTLGQIKLVAALAGASGSAAAQQRGRGTANPFPGGTNDDGSLRPTPLKITSILNAAYVVSNGDLLFTRTLLGLRNTVLLPAGWGVSAVSQSGTIGMYQGRAFVALINLHAENSYSITMHARGK